jgi:membrane-associated phospholipid phosphatase
MSRIPHPGTLGLLLAAVLATSCMEPGIAPTSTELIKARATASDVRADVAPSSPGWQEQARLLVGQNRLSPLAAARVFAALSVAQYRAVMDVDDADDNGVLPANGLGVGGQSALEAHRGAVAGASVRVLSFLFPAAAGSLEQRAAAAGSAGPGNLHPQFARGLELGRVAGNAMVVRLSTDLFTAPWTGTVPTGDGMWIANGPPAGATFGGVTPYFLTSSNQFRPLPPPDFGSTAFLADLSAIKTLSDNRTNDQRALAVTWNYATGTFTPPGYWDLVTANYIQAYGLDERAATRAFALMSAAAMDALIGCWEAKYHYWTIRPSQAEPGIISVFNPLPNHPSYPSGHSCVSAAAATVLSHLFPDRATELSTWVEEAGLSRMYAGIHYEFDITAGRNLGQAVAQWAISLDEAVGLLNAVAR